MSNYKYPDRILDDLIDKEEMHDAYAKKFKMQQKQINELQNAIYKALHRIQLLQMEGEVELTDLSKIANILLRRKNERRTNIRTIR